MTECENSATLVTHASEVPNATPLSSVAALDHVAWTLSLCLHVTKFCRQEKRKPGLLATTATVMCSPHAVQKLMLAAQFNA